MCFASPSRPQAPPPPKIDPLPPEEIFAKTALRIGNKRKAGVKVVGGKDAISGTGLSQLRLSNYGGLNSNY